MTEPMELHDELRCSRRRGLVTVEDCLEDYYQGNWLPDRKHVCYKCKAGAAIRDGYGRDLSMPPELQPEERDD